MDLTMLEAGDASVRAGYSCPCGCTPSVEYRRGDALVEDGCCCGNHFAVGPDAGTGLGARAGFRPELQVFDAPWGERLEAAWLVGPSVHDPEPEHGHDHPAAPGPESAAGHEVDPVCGMAVEVDTARAAGLHLTHAGVDYFFCGRGCKLEFGEDPERYLDQGYVPSM